MIGVASRAEGIAEGREVGAVEDEIVVSGSAVDDVSATVGGDGVVYSGWIEDFPPTTPANFEEALASTSLSMIGELHFCD